MVVLEYYTWTLHWFQQRVRNNEIAEDYTQDFFLHCWIHRAKISSRVGLNFLRVALDRFYSHVRQYNRASRRARTNELDVYELSDTLGYPAPQDEQLYTKQLMGLVNRINKPRLKESILYLLENGSISKLAAKHWEIIKYYGGELDVFKARSVHGRLYRSKK